VSRSVRTGLFLVSALGLGALVLWGLAGLPAFGDYPGPYGDLISRLAIPQRHMSNTVTAVVFDYRGFDTMGEELLLFAAASATALLLRTTRESDTAGIVDGVRSDASRASGAVASVVGVVLGLDVVAHGFISPGGGFQGGVVLAASLALLFLAVEYRAFVALAPTKLAEPVESLGAGGYVGLGLLSLAFGLSFLENFMPLGATGRLTGGGSAILVNWSAALAVCGGFLVVFGEFLQENMAVRHGSSRRPR
jgi:multicomponent Na+:H+ antiporter subunit B